MGLNGCWAFSGFMALLRNTELKESTAIIVSGELLELGRVTLFLKVVHYKHSPEKWPELRAVWALRSWPTQQECAGTFRAYGVGPSQQPALQPD